MKSLDNRAVVLLEEVLPRRTLKGDIISDLPPESTISPPMFTPPLNVNYTSDAPNSIQYAEEDNFGTSTNSIQTTDSIQNETNQVLTNDDVTENSSLNSGEFVVEEIIDKHIYKSGAVRYKVKFKDYPDAEWIDEVNLSAPELLAQFNLTNTTEKNKKKRENATKSRKSKRT